MAIHRAAGDAAGRRSPGGSIAWPPGSDCSRTPRGGSPTSASSSPRCCASGPRWPTSSRATSWASRSRVGRAGQLRVPVGDLARGLLACRARRGDGHHGDRRARAGALAARRARLLRDRGGRPAGLLLYRSTQYATAAESLDSSSPGLEVAYYYGIASMAVGYYFITLHYARALAAYAARLAARGRAGAIEGIAGLAVGLAIGAVLVGRLLGAPGRRGHRAAVSASSSSPSPSRAR